jgi:Domain of unknown function (DUF4262)
LEADKEIVVRMRKMTGGISAGDDERAYHFSGGGVMSRELFGARSRQMFKLGTIEQRIVDDIEKFGWHLILVNPDNEVPFVYSVGLMESFNHPEIMMIGLPLDTMSAVVRGMARQIKAGRNFARLGLYEGLLEGYACKVVRVKHWWHSDYLGYAMWHRRYVGKIGSLEVLQCVWPDTEGKFPGDEGSHPSLGACQPVLD